MLEFVFLVMMVSKLIKIGQFNTLRVVKKVPFGVYLDGDDWGEILLPNKVVPEGTQIDDRLDVFIYFDSEDKIIATTQQPHVKLGECAFLKAVDVNHVGAFLDWGLDKDLLVPKPEQRRPMEPNKSYLVYVKQDNQGRMIGSSKLDYCLDTSSPALKAGDEVQVLIADATDLGQKVVVDGKYWGLIYAGDVFEPLRYGAKKRGYIKAVRDDGKLDVTLRQVGKEGADSLVKRILARLHEQDGFLPLHDKSSPLAIQQAFGESKKSFKNALGYLYKRGEITLGSDGIRLKRT